MHTSLPPYFIDLGLRTWRSLEAREEQRRSSMFISKRNDGHFHHGPGGGGGGGSSSSSGGGLSSLENLMMMTVSPRSVLEQRALSGLAIALRPPAPPCAADHDYLSSTCKHPPPPPPPPSTSNWAAAGRRLLLGPDSVVTSPRALDTGCLRTFATRLHTNNNHDNINNNNDNKKQQQGKPSAAAPLTSSGVEYGSSAAASNSGVEDDDGPVAPMSIPILQNADPLACGSLPERHPHWHLSYEMDRYSCSPSNESIFHSTSPSTSFYNPEFPVADDFLSKCSYCSSRLGPGKDIYMYRGDRAFCSAECRYEQIVADEHKEAH